MKLLLGKYIAILLVCFFLKNIISYYFKFQVLIVLIRSNLTEFPSCHDTLSQQLKKTTEFVHDKTENSTNTFCYKNGIHLFKFVATLLCMAVEIKKALTNDGKQNASRQ